MKHSLVSATLALLASACAANGGEPEDVDVQQHAIINGNAITTDPEIGTFWGPKGPCTATLIRPNAILTAAHCFDYDTDTGEGANGGIFIYENFASERMIDAYISLGGEGGNSTNDVAVGRLVSPVDGAWDRIFPRDFAGSFPTNSMEVVRIIGYGCGDFTVPSDGVPFCTKNSDFTVKRELDFYWFGLADDLKLSTAEAGQLNVLVNGDSGGPVLDGFGRVILINSATTYDVIHKTATDEFGNVPFNSTKIAQALGQLGIL